MTSLVYVALRVPADPLRAFDAFTDEIALWWRVTDHAWREAPGVTEICSPTLATVPRGSCRRILKSWTGSWAGHRLRVSDDPIPSYGNEPFGYAPLLCDFIKLPLRLLRIART